MQAEEAKTMARQMVEVYADFAINCAAMPVIPGVTLLTHMELPDGSLSLHSHIILIDVHVQVANQKLNLLLEPT